MLFRSNELYGKTTFSFGVLDEFYKKEGYLAEIIADNLSKHPELKESKIYKEYGFLSQKNSKLHSTLMENLMKDLKNKRG